LHIFLFVHVLPVSFILLEDRKVNIRKMIIAEFMRLFPNAHLYPFYDTFISISSQQTWYRPRKYWYFLNERRASN